MNNKNNENFVTVAEKIGNISRRKKADRRKELEEGGEVEGSGGY